jgi:ferrous iron transport protein A
MLLHQLKVGDMAVIDTVNVNGPLKERFHSLGIMEQESVCVTHYGLFRSTVQVMTESSFIALRKEEADCIEVHKVA